MFGAGSSSNNSNLPHRASSFHLMSNSSGLEADLPYLDTNGRPYPWHDIRLPTFIKPISYELFMAPSMDNFYNHGNVTIELDLAPNTSTNFLVIHSKKLNISAVKVAQMERQPNHNNAN